jgi:WS/DGAT/MGAT family acyltransferase
MSDTPVNECLSSVDAFFLYLEQPGAPLNVASISAFEGLIALNECTKHIESRLWLMPRFVQRVVPPPFGLGLPTWQVDSQFDIRNHIREVTLNRGTEAEWKAAVSQHLSTHLDRNRPLWDITLFHGLKDNRTGIVVRTHHCLIDGVAGVGMLKALLDSSPIPSAQPRRKRKVEAPPPRDSGTVLLDGLISSCFSAAQALLTAHSELLRMAQQASAPKIKEQETELHSESDAKASSGISQLGDLTRILAELAQPTERLSYNVLCHGPQKFEWLEIPMAEITAVKQVCAGTVNDVVLTTLTFTLRRYAELHHSQVKGRTLRLVIPVNLRGVNEASDMGNHITFLPVDIPFGISEPQNLIATVQKRVAASRTAHAAELVGLVQTLLGAVPSSLQSLIGTILSQLPISLCNSICTNVHGPRTPLYLLGHKMLSSYPYVPIGGEMGMNCAVLSYDGALFVGFTGDARAIPDIERLPVFFRESFEDLKRAVGLHVPKQKVSRPKRKAKPIEAKKEHPKEEPALNVTEPVSVGATAASAVAVHDLSAAI